MFARCATEFVLQLLLLLAPLLAAYLACRAPSRAEAAAASPQSAAAMASARLWWRRHWLLGCVLVALAVLASEAALSSASVCPPAPAASAPAQRLSRAERRAAAAAEAAAASAAAAAAAVVSHHTAAAAVQFSSQLRTCAPPLPAAAHCNAEKEIPVSDDALPAAMRARWQRWLQAPGEAPGRGCCAISDAYRFIFVKMGKCAGSTVLSAFLRPAVCPVPPGGVGRFARWPEPEHEFAADCPPDRFLPIEEDCMLCTEIPRWKWVQYYVFSVIRHPLARAASAYKYCKDFNGRGELPFAQFCENPDGGPNCVAVVESIPETKRLAAMPDMPNFHWRAQTASLCSDDGRRCILDFAVRFETLAEDLDAVVTSINAHRLPGLPPLPLFSARPHHVNALKPGVATATDDELFSLPENAHCAAALKRWFAADMSILGYQ